MTPESSSATNEVVRGKSGPRAFSARAKYGRGRRIVLIVLWALVVAGIAGVSFLPADRPAMALALEVKGAVAISLPGHENVYQPLTLGQPFAAGSRVMVSNGGSAIFLLLPGMTAQVEDAADFSVDELVLRKHGVIVEKRHAVLTLHAGRIRCAVTMPEDRQVDLQISTPAGIVECEPGSILSATVSPEVTRVVCGWGALRWKAPVGSVGTALSLLAGEFGERTAAFVPQTAARKVTEDARAQEEMAVMFRVATAVGSLETDHRLYARPFSPSKD